MTGYEPVIVEWAYAREVMRCLGFDPEDLFFVVSNTKSILDSRTGETTPVNGLVVSLVLRTQGKTFNWSIGETRTSRQKLQKEYERLCGEWNSGAIRYDKEAFQNSWPFKQAVGLIAALKDKGFEIPRN